MTELEHGIVRQTTRQTVTGVTYADVTGATISNTSLTAGKKYLLVVNAQIDGSSVSLAAKARMIHGSTVFADSEWSQEPNTVGVRYPYSWFTVWTAVTGENVTMQLASETGAGTTGVNLISMVWWNLSSDGGVAENTDWFFDSNSTSTTLPAINTDTSTNNASVTFTSPAVASQPHLVMTLSRITYAGADATTRIGSRIVRSGEASETEPFLNREVEDVVNESVLLINMRVYTPGASASNTFTEKSFSQIVQGGSRQNSAVFVINLSKFKNVVNSAYATGAVSIDDATDYAVNVKTLSIQPDVTGDVMLMASGHYATNSGTVHAKIRLQVDNTDEPANQTTNAYELNDTWQLGDRLPLQIFTMTDDLSSSSSHTIDFDGSVNIAGGTRTISQRSLVAFTMELATVTPLLEVVNETEAISENVVVRMHHVETKDETENITENVVVKLQLAPQIVNEQVSITEATVIRMDRVEPPVNEPIEIAENVVVRMDKVELVGEELTISENIIVKLGAPPVIEEINEAVSISENVIIKITEVEVFPAPVPGGGYPKISQKPPKIKQKRRIWPKMSLETYNPVKKVKQDRRYRPPTLDQQLLAPRTKVRRAFVAEYTILPLSPSQQSMLEQEQQLDLLAQSLNQVQETAQDPNLEPELAQLLRSDSIQPKPAKVAKSFVARYDILTKINKPFTMQYEKNTLVSKTFIASYDIKVFDWAKLQKLQAARTILSAMAAMEELETIDALDE